MMASAKSESGLASGASVQYMSPHDLPLLVAALRPDFPLSYSGRQGRAGRGEVDRVPRDRFAH
jgi:hypothetical protein